MTTERVQRTGSLWAITSYFNPCGYEQKLANYRVFRQRLAAPLVCVELSYADGFELGPADADILVQLRGDAIMWQKERLLNVGLEHLPGACEVVAWLDGDVVFERDDWPELAIDGLREHQLIHLFRERHDLSRSATASGLDLGAVDLRTTSLAHRMQTGETEPDDFRRSNSRAERGTTTGLAWAARREVVAQHGLYDACIVGGGDRVITCAAIGKFDWGIASKLMNEKQGRYYVSWARPFFEAVQGRIGSIRGRAYHLWHGDVRSRRYRQRHEGFGRYDFDPYEDIALDPAGFWRWSSDKPEMHAYIRDYFYGRDEDGAGDRSPPSRSDGYT